MGKILESFTPADNYFQAPDYSYDEEEDILYKLVSIDPYYTECYDIDYSKLRITDEKN